jgi:hypothetical protein
VIDLDRDRKYRLRRIGIEIMPRATTAAALGLFLLAGKLVPGLYKVPFETHIPNVLHFGPWVTFASAISNVVLSWYGAIASLLLAPTLFVAVQQMRRNPEVRIFFERLKTSGSWWGRVAFPLAAIERKRNIERMCSLYALLLETGKRTFLEATVIVARTIESEQVRVALLGVVDRVESTKVSVVDAFALAEPVIDKITVRRFRTAALMGGKDGLAGMFAKRAAALREELDLKDFELVVPRIQFSASIPLVIGMVGVGMTVYEPILILLSNVRIR